MTSNVITITGSAWRIGKKGINFQKGRLVGGDGFEPPKASPADLQSAPFGHSGNHPLPERRCKGTVYFSLPQILRPFFLGKGSFGRVKRNAWPRQPASESRQYSTIPSTSYVVLEFQLTGTGVLHRWYCSTS